MKKKILAGLTLSLLSSLTMAAQTTDTVTVSATIPAGATCNITKSVSNVDLGDYDDATQSIGFVLFDIGCTGAASGTIDIYGSNGSPSQEVLLGPSGGLALLYDIFPSNGISPGLSPWASGTPFNVDGTADFNSGFAIVIPAGEISRNQGNLLPGVYSDTITIDVNYL